MKKRLCINLFFSFFISIFSYPSIASPSGTLGTLTVDNMMQGEFLWLKGRVGEGRYTFIHQDKRTCTINVAVAVGNISESNLGISETKGLTIVVVSQQLNDALIQGKRITSEDWHLTTQKNDDSIDGLIINGVTPKEGFVLNSKRRWISWFMGDKNSPVCR